MQRQELPQDAITFVAQQREYHRREADVGADDYLPEGDRRNRPDVLGPYSRVREDDDVLIAGEVRRVVCAARGAGNFYALLPRAGGGWVDTLVSGADITDRAPADPNDQPLPVFLPKPDDADEPLPDVVT
jgi:hypothetical protein